MNGSRSYKLLLLGSLYLAQGLPYGFFTQALPVLMREAGLSLKAISATSLLFLPWALKFLWAPLVDRTGTRRQWILPLQLSAALGAGVLAFVDIGNSFGAIFAALLLFNLLAAMQDVATDGLAVRLLSEQERGLGNGLQVGAYRLGMVLGGGWLLWVFAKSGWQTMFLAMSGLLLLTCLPVLFLRGDVAESHASRPPLRRLLSGWAWRLRQPGLLAFIGLICAYKFGDSMVSSLIGPFLKDYGLSKEEIALLKGTLGSVAGLAGAALGGWTAWRLGRRAALLGCGLLQTLSLLPYLVVALGWGGKQWIWAGCLGEHLLGGMATVALFTLMMDASDPDHAGTDYTLLACAVVIGTGLASFTGAAIADAAGYAPMMVTGLLLSAAGCITLVVRLDRGAGPARLRAVWAARGP
ncbi:MFS transporter [Solimonas sp. K1W22B-7]|uniref:MFS transporter n=1 Tax=Solimonas sp. K1W22B-7 TaxID=2303331 RepID=UPI000E33487D|nr:MFS transporter [Solimonas sp. K1W22B-7]AXQ29847.1 MFS transporter [Solimonas sp. K1W22B-7]